MLLKTVTPSFLSLSRAPCRKSLDTSSFSSNHMMTNGSNQLQSKNQAANTSVFGRHDKDKERKILLIRYLRWILWYVLLESGQVLAVFIIKPLHFKVQVHIICTFTQAMLLVLWISKRRVGLRKIPLHNFLHAYSFHLWKPSSQQHRKTYPPWRISYLVQTCSTWPLHWSCQRSIPGETCKRQHSTSGNLLFNRIITQSWFYVTPSMFHLFSSQCFGCHTAKIEIYHKLKILYKGNIPFKSNYWNKKNHTWLMLLASTNKHSNTVP